MLIFQKTLSKDLARIRHNHKCLLIDLRHDVLKLHDLFFRNHTIEHGLLIA